MKIIKFRIYKLQNKIKYFAVLALFAVGSCTHSQNNPEKQVKPPAVQQNQVQNDVVKTQPESGVTPEASKQPISGQTEGKVILNPPHGQPGHRCEIPVGSPLTDSPVRAGAQSTVSTPVQKPATVNNPSAPTIENAMRMNSSQPRRTTTQSGTNNSRINPPHGQPGHRCDIAVGSPLP